MEDKRFPGSDNYGQNNEDEYSPLEETAEEIDDDDLDLSELLKKYMPETAEKSDGSDETAAEAFGSGADSEEALAESVDASEYGEFASEIYSDEDARRAAQADKAAYGEFGSDVADNDGGYADYAPDEASPLPVWPRAPAHAALYYSLFSPLQDLYIPKGNHQI